jgi:hypothetical protein
MKRSVLLSLLLATASCGSAETVVVVTLDAVTPEARVQLPPAERIIVTLANEAAGAEAQLDPTGITYPATFSITPTDRSGPLSVSVRVLSPIADGRAATGAGQIEILPGGRVDLTIRLRPDDYVISYQPGTHITSSRLGARQVAAEANGNLAFAYETTCGQPPCLFARLLDASGGPRQNEISRNTQHFDPSSGLLGGETILHPAIAIGPSRLAVAWARTTADPTARQVEIRRFSHDGTTQDQAPIALRADPSRQQPPDDIMLAPQGGNFLAVWSQEQGSRTTPRPRSSRRRSAIASSRRTERSLPC